MVTNIPLSLELLNRSSFKPESKNENLHSGWLQLPQGSVCTITENGVAEGTIIENGQFLSLVYKRDDTEYHLRSEKYSSYTGGYEQSIA